MPHRRCRRAPCRARCRAQICRLPIMIPMPGLHWGRIEGNEAWLIGCTSARTLYLGPGSSRSPSAEPTVCRSVHHFNVTVQPSSLNRIEGFAMPGRRDHARHGPWDNVGRVLRENTIKSLIQRDIPVHNQVFNPARYSCVAKAVPQENTSAEARNPLRWNDNRLHGRA